MLVLDENLPVSQKLLLRKWRVHFRVVGVDVGRWGTDDTNLIPLGAPILWSSVARCYRRSCR